MLRLLRNVNAEAVGFEPTRAFQLKGLANLRNGPTMRRLQNLTDYIIISRGR